MTVCSMHLLLVLLVLLVYLGGSRDILHKCSHFTDTCQFSARFGMRQGDPLSLALYSVLSSMLICDMQRL